MGTQLTNEWRHEQFANVVILMVIALGLIFSGMVTSIVCNANPQDIIKILAFVPVIRILIPGIDGAILSAWLRVRETVYNNILSLSVQSGDPRIEGQISALRESYSRWG